MEISKRIDDMIYRPDEVCRMTRSVGFDPATLTTTCSAFRNMLMDQLNVDVVAWIDMAEYDPAMRIVPRIAQAVQLKGADTKDISYELRKMVASCFVLFPTLKRSIEQQIDDTRARREN